MKEIINYLKQDFRANRKPVVMVGIIAIIFGLIIVYFSQPPQPLLISSLTEVSGTLDYFEPTSVRNNDSAIYLQDGGKYFVYSFINHFNKQDFARDVKHGDDITLYCEIVNTNSGNAYIVVANGKQYLTLNESNIDLASNNLIGFILGWTFTGVGAILLVIGIICYLLPNEIEEFN